MHNILTGGPREVKHPPCSRPSGAAQEPPNAQRSDGLDGNVTIGDPRGSRVATADAKAFRPGAGEGCPFGCPVPMRPESRSRLADESLNLLDELFLDFQVPSGLAYVHKKEGVGERQRLERRRYHVLFVDAQFAPTSPLMVQTLSLSSTTTNVPPPDDSIFISDVFNVTSNLLIDTFRLTLTTNAPGSPNPAGVLNYLNPSILWPASTPRLHYLTNYGAIESQNLAVFGGSQTSAYSSPASSTNPYAAFINAGGVTNYSSFIFASYFQNSGIFSASGGAIQLLQAQTAVLTNGAFLAPSPAGTIKIQGGSLLVSNQVLQAGNALTLSVTNRLDDGSLGVGADGVANRNIWYAGYGINLPVLPTNSSLRATTITNLGPATIVPNLWAGQDFGPVAAGFYNNAAIGRLILDGLTNTDRKSTR